MHLLIHLLLAHRSQGFSILAQTFLKLPRANPSKIETAT
jgi:hypothetical protein